MRTVALILVDIQNDFLPGGALAVPQGDEIIATVNKLTSAFDLVVATKDWHPKDHHSFALNHPGRTPGEVVQLDGLEQILWPAHCIQGTRGAEFALDLDTAYIDSIFFKGTDPLVDSYSCFFDNAHRRETGLREYLVRHGITKVYLTGLATDYCVKFSALDALTLGFETHVIVDGCRGVNLKPEDSARALEEIKKAGGNLVQSDAVLIRRQARALQPLPLARKPYVYEEDPRKG
ncbi:MAG: bifunctional nicotinamidase/pyrazinamidase [Verrucomicrobiales bacterium]